MTFWLLAELSVDSHLLGSNEEMKASADRRRDSHSYIFRHGGDLKTVLNGHLRTKGANQKVVSDDWYLHGKAR